MTQMPMKVVMKLWKGLAWDAVSKELSQIHPRGILEVLSSESLSKEEWSKSLKSHLFLKEKGDLSVKVYMVDGRNKQQVIIKKSKATSPTATLESVQLAATIDAHEECGVATFDIPNASAHTRLKHKEYSAGMRLWGKLAKLMVMVTPPKYTKYVTI